MEKDLTQLKQPYSGYMKYSILTDLRKISKNTNRTLSELLESAVIEYIQKYNLLNRSSPGDTA